MTGATDTEDHNVALFYNGTVGESLEIEAKLGYNYTWTELANGYATSIGNRTSSTDYSNDRSFYRGQVDLSYMLGERSTISAGGIWTWLRSKNLNPGSPNERLEESRANLYAFWDWAIRPNLFLRAGTHLEHIKTEVARASWDQSYWRLLPQLSLNYMPSQTVRLTASYGTSMAYPTAPYMIRPSYEIDEGVLSVGNPTLKPSLLHTITLQASVGEHLTLGAKYDFDSDAISEAYETTSSPVWGSATRHGYVNARHKELTLFAGYELGISKYLTWKNVVQYIHGQRSHSDYGKGITNNLLVESDLRYQIPQWQMYAGVNYRRMLTKEPSLQGWSDYGVDYWQLSLSKLFWSGRLGLTLNYLPPIHLGTRRAQTSVVDTPAYQMRREQSFRTYDHLVMLRMQLRLHSGKKARQTRQVFDFEKDRYSKDKGLM